ncbi:GTP cyclohydrolase II [Nocardia australiensis]|uniref:GTP cyclohydrolase II n=1 Tax=Nocardia australiensis TaxID=2887191 RepID=UPI001D144CB8|nr:GTP cyclohydrolase II [Nocardia australiensis]
MAKAARRLAETGHRLTRKGREVDVRVMPIPGSDDGGHALLFGHVTDGALVRIHSRCLYGDVLQSDDCDCGPELEKSMDLIQAAGRGVLVYLEQEGRGAGLVNKARGLRTSEQLGVDTFDSYERLGLSVDMRSYRLAAEALVTLGLRSVRLLTNNPDKVRAVREHGIAVTVVPLVTRPRNDRARRYLEAKRRRRGHMLPLELVTVRTRRAGHWRGWLLPLSRRSRRLRLRLP